MLCENLKTPGQGARAYIGRRAIGFSSSRLIFWA